MVKDDKVLFIICLRICIKRLLLTDSCKSERADEMMLKESYVNGWQVWWQWLQIDEWVCVCRDAVLVSDQRWYVEHGFENDSEVNVWMISFAELVKMVANLTEVSTCEWNRNVWRLFFGLLLPRWYSGSDLFCAFSIKTLHSLSSNRLRYRFRTKVVVSVLVVRDTSDRSNTECMNGKGAWLVKTWTWVEMKLVKNV